MLPKGCKKRPAAAKKRPAAPKEKKQKDPETRLGAGGLSFHARYYHVSLLVSALVFWDLLQGISFKGSRFVASLFFRGSPSKGPCVAF